MFNQRLAEFIVQDGKTVTQSFTNSAMDEKSRLRWLVCYVCGLWVNMCLAVCHRKCRILLSAANFYDVIELALLSIVVRRERLVFVAHFSRTWRFWHKPICVALLRWSSRRCTIYAIAPSQRVDFRACGIECDEELFPNIFSIRARADRSKRHRHNKPRVALYVGRVVAEKGLDRAVNFLESIASPDFPILFRIVGSGDEVLMAQLAGKGGPNLQIEMAGWRDENGVSEALLGCDFFLSFSLADTLPLNLLEAAAHCVPVVVERNSVTEDILTITGQLFFVDTCYGKQYLDMVKSLPFHVSNAPTLALIDRNREWIKNWLNDGAAHS
ncbi:MAG: glycosyltransferase [Brevundimonas sp.]|nr:glycosyltransferase [Brevundimonas sp.]